MARQTSRQRWRELGLRPAPAAVAERWRAAGWWRERTLWDDFAEVSARRPEHTAIVDPSASGWAARVSYAQLRRLAERVAAGLVRLGVRPGEIVTVQLPNWAEFGVVALGCARIGAVINPIVPIFRDREVRFILGYTGSRVCIVADAFRGFSHADMIGRLRPDLPELEHVFLVRGEGGPSGAGVESFERFFLQEADAPAGPDVPPPDADDVALVLFTSGTTGEPKGVIHTFNTLFAASRGNYDVLGLTPDDPVLMVSTLGHGTGFYHGYVMPFSHGMTAVYQDVWSPAAMLDLVQRERVAWTMAAAPFLMDAIREQIETPRELSSFRTFATAGAPIPPQLVRQSHEVLGAELVAIWGMTENGVPTITRPGDPVDVVADSDGRPVDWFEVRIVDAVDEPVPVGDVGRLLVRGAGQFLGYFRRPDLYDAAVTGGWMDTGDLARRRADGGIRIAGRTKDLILRGGENVPVLEVEAALLTHPEVAAAAVIGYPDERLGERACAVVVTRGGPFTFADLQQHLAGLGMAKQFWPERLEIVDALPTTAAGKVQKVLLRQRFAEPGR